jgi:hypothetical protein
MLVVFHQLAQHLARRYIALIVVVDRLQFPDLPDRAQRGAAQLANALGQLIGGRKNIVGLLVKQQMIIAEMPAADVPVKVLGLQSAAEILSTAACGRSVGVSSSGDVLSDLWSDLALLTMHLPVRKTGR